MFLGKRSYYDIHTYANPAYKEGFRFNLASFSNVFFAGSFGVERDKWATGTSIVNLGIFYVLIDFSTHFLHAFQAYFKQYEI